MLVSLEGDCQPSKWNAKVSSKRRQLQLLILFDAKSLGLKMKEKKKKTLPLAPSCALLQSECLYEIHKKADEV